MCTFVYNTIVKLCNLYAICAQQEKEQLSFFKKPTVNNNGDKPRDNKNGEDNDPPKRRRKKRDSENSSSSSSEDDLQSDLHRIHIKKEKKLRKDITIAINSPLALGLKYLTTDNIARASSNESAILLRTIKPVSATLNTVLKNDKLLEWDHPLLSASVKAVLVHQINLLKTKRKNKLADKLLSDAKDLMWELNDDQLLLTPKSVYAIFNALFTKDPHYTSVLDNYIQERPQFMAEVQNRQSSIARVTGYCLGYNFHGTDCDNQSCKLWHHCLLHNHRMQHKTMNCNDNPNKWKKVKPKNDNPRNDRRRGRYRGLRGRYGFQPQHIPQHVPFQHMVHMTPPQQWAHYPNYQQQQPPPIFDKKGNSERYNYPHSKK